MFFENIASNGEIRRAYEKFMSEVTYYLSDAKEYLIDLSMTERVFGLCIFILFLIYLIIARARRKYNPGSIGRQFVGAVIVVSAVLFAGDILFDHTPGAYASLFQL